MQPIDFVSNGFFNNMYDQGAHATYQEHPITLFYARSTIKWIMTITFFKYLPFLHRNKKWKSISKLYYL